MNFNIGDPKCPIEKGLEPRAQPYTALLNLPIQSFSYPASQPLLNRSGAHGSRPRTTQTSGPGTTSTIDANSEYLDILASLIRGQRLHEQHPAGLWAGHQIDDGSLSSLLRTGPLVPHAYPRGLLLASGKTVPSTSLPADLVQAKPDEGAIDVCTVRQSPPNHPTAAMDIKIDSTNSEDEQENELRSLLPLGTECARTVPNLMKCYSRHKRPLTSSLSVSLAVSGQTTPPSSPISPGTLPRAPPITPDRPTDAECAQSLYSTPSAHTIRHKVDTPPMTPKEKVVPTSAKRSASKASAHNAVSTVATTAMSQLVSTASRVASRPNPFTAGWSLPTQPEITPPAPVWIPQGVDPSVGASLGLGYQFARDPLNGHIILLPRAHPLAASGSGHGIMWAGFGGVPPPPMMMTPQQLLLSDPHFRTPLHPFLPQTIGSATTTKENESKCKSDKTPSPSLSGSELNLPTGLSSNVPNHYIYPPTSMPYFFPQLPLPTFSSHVPASELLGSARTTCTPSHTQTLSTAEARKVKLPPSPEKSLPDHENDFPIDLTKKSTEKAPPTRAEPTKPVIIKKEIKEELLSPIRPVETPKLKQEPLFAEDCTDSDSNIIVEASSEDSLDPGRSEYPQKTSPMTGLELLSNSILEHVEAHPQSQAPPPSSPSDDNSCHSETMPKLERISLSLSPRMSPSSCELPPVLTPLNRTPIGSPKVPSEAEAPNVCRLSILCALAEQELEVAQNCSALSSLAEVAAAHHSLDQTSGRPSSKRSWSDSSELSSPKVPRMENASRDFKEDINRNYQSPPPEIAQKSFDQSSELSFVTDNRFSYTAPVYEVTALPSQEPTDSADDVDSEELNDIWLPDPEEQHSFKGFSDGSFGHDDSENESKDTFADRLKLTTDTSVDSPASDIEPFSSSSKKRKPGRPKKHSPVVRGDSTETIVARQNSFDFMMVSHKPKIRPKLKAEVKIRESDNEEEFNGQEENFEQETKTEIQQHSVESVKNGVQSKPRRKRSSLTRKAMLQDKEKRKSSVAKQSQMEELYRSLKKHSKMAAPEHDESDDERETSPVKIKEEPEVVTSEVLPEPVSVSIDAEACKMDTKILEEKVDDIETFEEKEVSACTLLVEDLVSNTRVLVLQDGLLYAGNLVEITPPDVYGVHIDGERSTRPHIYCQEELLMQAWKEVKPGSTRFMTEGTRVCAFWSQQYRGLYPGTVAAASSPSHEGVHNFVNVEFDDGDSGRIHIDDIRLLPSDFPVIDYDPNPLLTLNKRKRRATEDSTNEKYPEGYQKKMPPGNPLKLIITKEMANVNEETPKKKHKKSKHKHKRKRSHSPQPYCTIEPGDSELRMRIRSPTHLSTERSFELQEKKSENPTKESETPQSPTEAKSPQAGERKKKRSPSEKSRIAPFLPDRQLWKWSGKGFKRPGAKGKGKKEFYKEIIRGKEHIRVGDCAVFLSTGRPDRPYIGKIELLWESWGGNMVVKVKWFYHPDETKGLSKKLAEPKGALFQSPHCDENDVQTVSRKCSVVTLAEYKLRRAAIEAEKGPNYDNHDLYYQAGFYDPYVSKITMEPGVS